jgi:hypothetical protein
MDTQIDLLAEKILDSFAGGGGALLWPVEVKR